MPSQDLPLAARFAGRLQSRIALRKVPEVIAVFWIVKVLTTAAGESSSDYVVHEISPFVAVAVGGVAFAASLLLQFRCGRYIPWVYWLTVLMVAIFGTMCADVLHIELGIPYLVSTLFFVVSLAAVFTLWYVTEKTLSIHRIDTYRREMFYWATVVTTFALGTAAGDMTAKTMNLGYFWSGVMFTALIAIPAIGYLRFDMNLIFAFWFAYVLTRPVGASFADWFGKPKSTGGLGLGDGTVSLVLIVIITGLVFYLAATRADVARATKPEAQLSEMPALKSTAGTSDRHAFPGETQEADSGRTLDIRNSLGDSRETV